ncbi:glycerol kinase GlpK [Granulicoccus phenolivorans]|uniref:glycerol kinase GlpK n=1 Tax=Granulicoccus phenolivorans TaxID=266854 RepID=UPI000418ED07|nr:glycerol kinase GlpK [Granulicoccus phenolivorans]
MQPDHVLAIDQGTTSSRAIVFDHDGQIVATGQNEHRQIFPRAGWVEHDAAEIWQQTRLAMSEAMVRSGLSTRRIATIGITNQRETTVVWDRHTGVPIHHAIVWQDTRTQAICDRLIAEDATRFTTVTGLPVTTYFAGPKIAWLLDQVPGARAAAEAGDLLFGTMDTWLIWNLTGGVDGGEHRTDVTNASRTLLMDLQTLQWDPELCRRLGIPLSMLPRISSSSEVYGTVRAETPLAGLPITGVLGDQQAALFGQACFNPGMAKNTYGTGNFLLLNTGEAPMLSRNGLITTVAARIGDRPATYALEGSIAVTGSLVQWLRDNLGLLEKSADIEELAAAVPDNGGAYLVPAFSGLYAPYWRPDARGALVGLTRFVTKHHLARAALEAAAYQTRDVVDAMNNDSRVPLRELRVDGGMTGNELLMQFQADQLDVPVIRPAVTETTALGAAYAAGLAVDFWADQDEIAQNWRQQKTWQPGGLPAERERLYRCWRKAVTRTFDWVDEDTVPATAEADS